MSLSRYLETSLHQADHPDTFLQEEEGIRTWTLQTPTHQTELNAVKYPLNGEAGQEDHAREKYQAEIEAAGLETHGAHLSN